MSLVRCALAGCVKSNYSIDATSFGFLKDTHPRECHDRLQARDTDSLSRPARADLRPLSYTVLAASSKVREVFSK